MFVIDLRTANIMSTVKILNNIFKCRIKFQEKGVAMHSRLTFFL